MLFFIREPIKTGLEERVKLWRVSLGEEAQKEIQLVSFCGASHILKSSRMVKRFVLNAHFLTLQIFMAYLLCDMDVKYLSLLQLAEYISQKLPNLS